jgi:hypothetical protein
MPETGTVQLSSFRMQACVMDSFDDLVAARKAWLQEVLQPWCERAPRKELLKAEPEWLDIAGKVPPEKTLWRWAWSRFPELVHESLGIEETSPVEICLHEGRKVRGFPDARKSQRGQLFIWGTVPDTGLRGELGPYSIDDIASIRRCTEDDEI